MNKKVLFVLVLVLVLTLGVVSTATAAPEPVDFETCYRGMWTWQFFNAPYWFYMDLVEDPNHPWFLTGETLGACGDAEYELTIGEPLIAYLGSYTVTVEEAYANSVLELSFIPEGQYQGVDFARRPVGVFHDGVIGSYQTLQYDIQDLILFEGFMDEEVSLFYKDANGVWNPCTTSLHGYAVDAAEFGYASCVVWDVVTGIAPAYIK